MENRHTMKLYFVAGDVDWELGDSDVQCGEGLLWVLIVVVVEFYQGRIMVMVGWKEDWMLRLSMG